MRNQLNITYKTTYMQLTQALTALGFTRKDAENLIVFREAKHEALIALPFMDNAAFVSDPHLIGISNTIIGKGIATKEKLYSLLRSSHKSPSAKTSFLAPTNRAKIKRKLRTLKRRKYRSVVP